MNTLAQVLPLLVLALSASAVYADGLSCEELHRQLHSDWLKTDDAVALAQWEAGFVADFPAYSMVADAINERYLKDFDYDRRLLQSWVDGDYNDSEAVLDRFGGDGPRAVALDQFTDVSCWPGQKKVNTLYDSTYRGHDEMKKDGSRVFCVNPAEYDRDAIPKTMTVFRLDMPAVSHDGSRKQLTTKAERLRVLEGIVIQLNAYFLSDSKGHMESAAIVRLSLLDLFKMRPGQLLTPFELAQQSKPKVTSFEETWAKGRPTRCPREMPIELSAGASDQGEPKSVVSETPSNPFVKQADMCLVK